MSLSDCKMDENAEEKTELGIWRTNNFALGKAIQILQYEFLGCDHLYLNSPPEMFVMRAFEKNVLIRYFI